MKMRVKSIIVDVVENDGMWLDKSTMTYYEKDALEPMIEPQELDEAATKAAEEEYPVVLEQDPGCSRAAFDDINENERCAYYDGFIAGAKWVEKK